MSKSPSIMRAHESDADKCDGCGCSFIMNKNQPVMFVESYGGSVICGRCIRWALPQIDLMEAATCPTCDGTGWQTIRCRGGDIDKRACPHCPATSVPGGASNATP